MDSLATVSLSGFLIVQRILLAELLLDQHLIFFCLLKSTAINLQ